MPEKLEKLTEAQQARLKELHDEWLQISLSTGPADLPVAKEAIRESYRLAGLTPPERWLHVRSPIEGAHAILLLNVLSECGKDHLFEEKWKLALPFVEARTNVFWGGVSEWGKLIQSFLQRVGEEDVVLSSEQCKQLRQTVIEQLEKQCYGCHDAFWLAKYAAFIEFGVTGLERAVPMITLAKACGWWSPYDDIVIIQDKPSSVSLDDELRLHSETGPAIGYSDGFGTFAWHGTRIPAEWIMKKSELSAQVALTHPNIEQRRAAAEIIGWDKVLAELEPTVVDTDVNPEVGVLLEVALPDVGNAKFLKVRCGTGRMFVLPVPLDMKTAIQANAWTYNVGEDVIRNLGVRT